MEVPLVDLKIQFRALRDEIMPRMESVCEQTAFILGQEVRDFERDFASFCGTKYCVGVATGCDAIYWSLKALGVGPGDEVITVANTFIATIFAISHTGAKPVLVDCRYDDLLMDSSQIEKAITPQTKAVVVVHLYGQTVAMNEICAIADRAGLPVVEDAAQAHGARYEGKPCGSLARAGAFSFYPGKNLGAYGDGGAVTTDDPAIAEFVAHARNYGQTKKYHHDVLGGNSRLDTLQAAVLNVKLPKLAAWNRLRAQHAATYRDRLAALPLKLVEKAEGTTHVYHLFVVRHPSRDEIMKYLGERGVYCGIHYPVPVHLQQAYRHLGYRQGDFPVAEATSDEIFSLPMFPEMTMEQLGYVADGLCDYFAGK